MEKEGYIGNLVKYIEKNISKGYAPESLKWALLSQGYTKSEFEKAMKIVIENQAMRLPPIKEKPVITIETEPPIQQEKSFFGKIRSWFS